SPSRWRTRSRSRNEPERAAPIPGGHRVAARHSLGRPHLTWAGMPRIAFADESGTDDHSRCYAIGVASVLTSDRDDFERRVVALKATHGVVGEAKWTRVRNSHGLINFPGVFSCSWES